MSGVWVFKPNGVIKLIDPQLTDAGLMTRRNKASLVHLPSGNVVSSYTQLEQILRGRGWERYYEGNPNLLQFHKRSTVDLISLPWDFSKFSTVYMYDIVVKNPNVFKVST